MQAQYGNTIEFIGGFRMLPQAIERLLKWTFLYGSRIPMSGVRFAGGYPQKTRQQEDQRG